MTFEQFQSTKMACDNVAPELNDDPLSGFYYAGSLYIYNFDGVANGKPLDRFWLHIENMEWTAPEIETLERILYDYALGQGLIAV